MHLHGVIACSLVCIYPFLPFAEPLYSIKRILGTLGTDTDGGPQVCFFTFYFFLKKELYQSPHQSLFQNSLYGDVVVLGKVQTLLVLIIEHLAELNS